MMKKLLTLLLALLCSASMWADDFDYPDNLYLVGGVTPAGWSNVSDALAKTTMDQVSEGVYVWTGKLYECDSEHTEGFKIVKSINSWHYLHPSAAGFKINERDDEFTRICNDCNGSDDAKWQVSVTGTYTVTVKITDDNGSPTIHVSAVQNIATLADLQAFATNVNTNANATAAKAILTADITESMDYAIGWYNNDGDKQLYSGTFDGQGHSITLSIDKAENDNQALFGAIGDGALIKNVVVSGSVTGQGGVGGIVATVRGTGEVNIQDCVNNATINGKKNAAGIVGVTVWTGSTYCRTNILRCKNTGNVTGDESALISGWLGNGSIKYCIASGSISGNDDNREFSRYGTCDFYANVTLTGNSNTGGAMYYNPSAESYDIANADQFLTIATLVNNGYSGKSFNLTNDIDLNGKVFTPIGTDANRYHGVFNGQNHRIKNMVINSDVKEQALFSVCSTATIKNLIIDSSCSVTGKSSAYGNAAFVAVCNGSGTLTFENCGNEANVVGYGPNNAAFVGFNWSNGLNLSLTNCYNSGTIGDADHGSDDAIIIGWNAGNSCSATNFYNTGEIKHIDSNGRTLGRGNGSWSYNNCFNTQSDTDFSGKTNNFPAEKVASGELCYALGNMNWFQKGSYPIPFAVEGTSAVLKVSSARYATYAPAVNVQLPADAYNENTVRVYYYKDAPEGEAIAVSDATQVITSGKTIAAGTGIVVKAEEGYVLFPVNTTAEPTELTGNKLVGVLEDTARPGDATYIFKNGSQGIGFYPWVSGTLAAGKCYLQLSGNQAPAFVGLDEEETGIVNVNDDVNVNLYNLAGQRITKMQRGVNIVNGKKVLK